MILATIPVLIGFGLLVFYYWQQVLGPESALGPVSFWPWMWAGLVVPSAVWLFLNCGLFSSLPPLIPRIARAQADGGKWLPLLFRLPTPGLVVIGSYWAAITFAQLVAIVVTHAESRREFALTAGLWTLCLSPFVWVALGGGVPWAGIALLLWLVPVVHGTLSMACRPKPAPMYSRAVSRIKFGRYREAEQEVLQQLEKREDDFEGWMMLAELYAKQFGDLAEADRTVRSLCDEPNITALQVSLACHRLADWHLHLGDNPIGARRALEEICRRLPDTHFAHMAQLRVKQLPASREEWLEQKKPKAIRLPALAGDLDESQEAMRPKLARSDALSLVNECVDRLKRNPNDVAPRERLADLLAESLGKADLGIEQLQLLLAMTNQPEQKRAEWLSRLALWEFRYRNDRPGARQLLTRLIEEYPQSAQAFAAQRWLSLLDMEQRLGTTRERA